MPKRTRQHEVYMNGDFEWDATMGRLRYRNGPWRNIGGGEPSDMDEAVARWNWKTKKGMDRRRGKGKRTR